MSGAPRAALRRWAAVAALAAAAWTPAAAAGPAPYQLIADSLDPGAPAATLPAGPVAQALAELAADAPTATVLVPVRVGERAGTRWALAAWRSAPGAAEWDAMLVLALPEGARTLEASSRAKDVEAALAALLEHALASPPPAPPAPPVAKVEVLPHPERWEPRFLVELERDPRWVASGEPRADAALAEAQLQWLLRLQRDGLAQAAGPLPEAGPSGALLLLRVRDRATAERIAAEAPAVKAGQARATVREWRIPAGRLP